MLAKPLNQTWQLDMFPGGSASESFHAFMKEIEEKSQKLDDNLKAVSDNAGETAWVERIAMLQWLKGALIEAESFIGCLAAQNQKDEQAKNLNGKIKQFNASFASTLNRLDGVLLAMKEPEWKRLLSLKEAKEIAFWLGERRQLAAEKLSPEMESLIHTLAVDGYHAWGEHYHTAVGRISVEYKDDQGETGQYSAGQAANLLHHPDRPVRTEVFRLWEEAWSEQADICAAALNHLAGFRLGVYNKRGWSSVLKEPLAINRMSEQTLRSMWEAIEANKQPFIRYLRRKAKLLGVEKLRWFDVDAPLGGSTGKIGYDDAAELIVKQFNRFSPDLAEFSEMAFEKSWIEAEDRAAKRPGGFCTSFPLSGETRIFMTYGGTASNVATLAHELGHAYHGHVMNGLPMLAQDYAMNVAETASTFAELIVSDAAVSSAADDRERIALLEEKIQSSVTFYMNIHARFIFETAFYEQRRKGLVGVSQLNALMEEAQRQAYCGELGQYHPCFWASKLHFYLTDVPFYNFPYTFGYLFSAGIYAIAAQDGRSFASRYVALLRDTGSMTVEDLAAKHLGVDLRKPDFWQSAIAKTVEDAELFLKLTE